MKIINPRTVHVLNNPVAFALQVLKAFQANQGLLLAGAVAYYALLSSVTLLDNGQVLIAGGQNQTNWVSSADLHDPTAGTFSATGSMAAVRGSHTAVALPNRKVLLVGGCASSDTPGAELYFY